MYVISEAYQTCVFTQISSGSAQSHQYISIQMENEPIMISVALDEELEARQAKKLRKWVNEAWRKRNTQGECITLYKELVNEKKQSLEYLFHIPGVAKSRTHYV